MGKLTQKNMKKVTILLSLILGSLTVASAAQSVQTISPEVRSISRETQQPANLLALQSASIGARVDGYVREVLVDIGDAVKKGDVLARIDAPELAAHKQIALAEQSRLAMSMRSAKADLMVANAENARIKALVAKKSLSEKVALESKSKVAAANANVAAAAAEADIATAKLQAADALLSFTELRAPFDGVVAVRSVDLGDQVKAGNASAPLFVVEDQSVLRMVTYVPERDAVLVDAGDAVTVSVNAFPGKQLSATVSRASGSLSSSNAQRMRVEAEIPNADGSLPAGLYGTATILLEQKDKAIVVPAEVVRFGEDPVCVYVVEGGVLRHVAVELGLDGGKWIEVTSGLQGNEAIVTGLIGRLADGTSVSVR